MVGRRAMRQLRNDSNLGRNRVTTETGTVQIVLLFFVLRQRAAQWKDNKWKQSKRGNRISFVSVTRTTHDARSSASRHCLCDAIRSIIAFHLLASEMVTFEAERKPSARSSGIRKATCPGRIRDITHVRRLSSVSLPRPTHRPGNTQVTIVSRADSRIQSRRPCFDAPSTSN